MGLYKKMHEIMIATEGLEKKMTVGKGYNEYKAVSEASVLNAIKPLLKQYGLIIFPTKIDATNWKDEFTTKNGLSARLVTQVKATYKIVDIETGESEILETVGHGVDNQDKASGKAMTYAYKALIQKTFCMFSGEDTDNEHSDDITKRQTKKPATPAPKNSPKASTELLESLKSIAAEKGGDLEKSIAYLKKEKLEDLTQDEANRIIAGLRGKK